MNDLISRQAAIDVLDVLCQEHRYKIPGKIETYSQYNEAWQDALDRAEGAIFNLPSAHPEQRWIPCSERYPDMDERVLVYTGAHEYHVWDCMSNRADNYFWEDEEGLYHGKYEVDLWMPLPEPYQENKDERD